MRKTLSDNGVAALKPRASRYAYPDPQLAGHYIRITPNGAKSFAAVTRDPDGKQIWTTLGTTDRMTIATSRALAREAITRVRAGLPAVEPKKELFGNVVSNWLTRHVERNGLRSRDEIVRLLDRHILPAWRNREFVSIRRSDITALLDKVEDGSGARQADYCLNIVRSVMNWYALAARRLQSADRRGMRRQSPHAQARTRTLTDDEIRAIWRAAETDGTFGALIRIALLTAQRREKSAPCGGTTFRTRASGRFHGHRARKIPAGVLVLPDAAREIIHAQPRLGDNPYVFAGRGDGP